MNLNKENTAGTGNTSLNPENSESDSNSTLFTIEGNIGCGKSTFLKILKKHFSDIKLIEEPVAEWQNVEGKGLNILQKYYKDPKRWGLTFLNYAPFTRVKKWRECQRKYPNATKITERCILADKYVFGSLMKDLGFIEQIEYAVFQEMYKIYNQLLDKQPPFIIYLRCQPEVCYERTKKRSRSEEQQIPLDYLNRIHDKHQSWMKLEKPSNVLILDTTQDFQNSEERTMEMVEKLREFLKVANKA